MAMIVVSKGIFPVEKLLVQRLDLDVGIMSDLKHVYNVNFSCLSQFDMFSYFSTLRKLCSVEEFQALFTYYTWDRIMLRDQCSMSGSFHNK